MTDFPAELQTPHLLARDELAEHLNRYAAALNLNIVTSAKIQSTLYDQEAKQWTVKFQTLSGEKTVVCKQLVQATGIGSARPYLPPMSNGDLFKGINLHSAEYKNAKLLVEQGAKVGPYFATRTADRPTNILHP